MNHISQNIDLKNKRVLVTGAGGFIGSHLIEQLAAKCLSARALVRYNCRGDIGNLKWIDKDILDNIEIYFGDICELETIKDVMKNIDIVFNLAAFVGIPYSYKHPQEVVDVNLKGTLNILTAARELNIEKVVQTSTSEVYGSALYVPIDEKHPKQPQSPYSASKIGADAIALSFYMSYGLPVSIARPFNTYGPRQSDRAIIPATISQALTKDVIHIGNTDTTRDFNYVLNTVDGFIKIAESPESVGQEINIGSGLEIKISDLIEKIVRLIGKDIKVIQDKKRLRPEKSEVSRLLAENRKARELLGWTPMIDLDEGIKLTTEWIRSKIGTYSPEKYNT